MGVDPRMQGIFKGIEAAKASFTANYVRPGKYLCVIRALKVDTNRKKIPFCAWELGVLMIIEGNRDEPSKTHQPREEISWYEEINNEYFLRNFKGAISVVLGCEPGDVTEADCDAVVKDDQPLSNTIIEVHANTQMTKKDTPFTKVKFARTVSARETQALMLAQPNGQSTLDFFFPNGLFDRLVAAESSSAPAQTPEVQTKG